MLTQRNGKPVPLGSSVSDETGGGGGGIVEDSGQVFMSGLKPNGKLISGLGSCGITAMHGELPVG